jgi:hypothetical protein
VDRQGVVALQSVRNDDMTSEERLPVVGVDVLWRKVTLSEHYPTSGGGFASALSHGAPCCPKPRFLPRAQAQLRLASTTIERRGLLPFARQCKRSRHLDPFSAPATAFSAEYGKVQNMPDLEVLHWLISEDGYGNEEARHPDRAATAKFLHEYLDTKVGNNIRFKENVEAVLALELAAGSPKLYARAVAFQGALGEPSRKDLRDLRVWLRPRYRRLMLEVAQSMVTTHKKTPGSFEDDNLEFKAEDLVTLNVPECSNTQNFLSESELRHFMRDAGLSSTFITEQIAEMRQASSKLRKAE